MRDQGRKERSRERKHSWVASLARPDEGERPRCINALQVRDQSPAAPGRRHSRLRRIEP